MTSIETEPFFVGVPRACHLAGFLGESLLDLTVVEPAIEDIIAVNDLANPTGNERKHLEDMYGLDSLDLIEMRSGLEDCKACCHGIGNAACRLGAKIATID